MQSDFNQLAEALRLDTKPVWEAVSRIQKAVLGAASARVTVADGRRAFPFFTFADESCELEFQAPRVAEVVGGLANECVNQKVAPVTVDLVVEMPVECLARRDLRQPYHYHDKRLLFLTGLAGVLEKHCASVTQVACFGSSEDRRKPLLLASVGKGGDVVVRMIPTFAKDHPKLSMRALLPSLDGAAMYNGSIAEDVLVLEHARQQEAARRSCPFLSDAMLLAKGWLRSCGVDGELNGFHASMLLCYLRQVGKFNDSAPALSMFRAFLAFLADKSSFANGLFWPAAGGKERELPEMLRDVYRKAFDVVFVDQSGFVNLTWRVSRSCLLEVQAHAVSTLAVLEGWQWDRVFDIFTSEPEPFPLRWDHVHRVVLHVGYGGGGVSEYRDVEGATARSIVEVLRKGLGSRCTNVACRWERQGVLLVGVRLDHSSAFRKLDAGPAADDKEKAAEFRKFWGPKAELRRFRDGSIIESVVWECPFEERMNIPAHVAAHLLHHHFGVAPSDIRSWGTLRPGLLIDVANPFSSSPSSSPALTAVSGDAVSLNAVNVAGDLSKVLRELKLPLPIKDVWPCDPVFRSCDVFPPEDSAFAAEDQDASRNPASLVLRPLTVYIQHEGSSAWPEDVEAIRNLQAAFRIRIHDELFRAFAIKSLLCKEHLDVLFKGFVFRLRTYLKKEAAMVKEVARARALSQLTSALAGFHLKNNAFGSTVRLCKRWLHAHMLSGKVGDEAVELTVMHVFASCFPHVSAPAVPAAGFLRWLRLLARHAWATEPLVVSVNGDAIPAKDVAEGRAKMQKRGNAGAVPFIITEFDNTSMWTVHAPSEMVWGRVVALAKAALHGNNVTVDPEPALLRMFGHNLADYDAVINLDLAAIPNHWQNIRSVLTGFAVGPSRFSQQLWLTRRRRAKIASLLIDYSPVRDFIEELEARFSKLAWFFYDEHGGGAVGVLFRPGVRERHWGPSVENLICAMPSPAEPGKVSLDVKRMMASMRAIGAGLVVVEEEQ